LIGSILKQLFSGSLNELTQEVDGLYNDFKDKKPDPKRIWNILKGELLRFEEVYVIIDALDDCPDNNAREAESYNPRYTLLSKLVELQDLPNVMIMVTSRPMLNVQKELHWSEIEISARDHDINLFLETRIKNYTRIAKFKKDAMIKEGIVKNCQGMCVYQLQCSIIVERPSLNF
jgi:hypothetical protein